MTLYRKAWPPECTRRDTCGADDLRDQTALVSATAWRRQPDHAQTSGWEHEAAEHRAMLRAAQDGEAERAAGLLRRHITSFVARNFPEPQENQKV